MTATMAPAMTVIDLLAEATRIVGETIQGATERAAHSAEICGCRGCKAQAAQAVEWASGMLASDAQLDE